MADEDQNVRMPMDGDEDDEEERAWREYNMDDLREDESDEEENYDDDDDDEDEDVSVDSIESGEEEEEVDNEIVDKFTRTFHKGDYDAEFDDALSYDRSVIPPARHSQASYNKPDNWQDRNQIGLERVKKKLQTYIDSVSNSVGLMLLHNFYEGQLMDNEEPIVWHEPILEEYWNHFEAKIDQMKQLNIGNIQVKNVEMKKERLAALLAIFCKGRANNSSTCLDFDNVHCTNTNMLFILALLAMPASVIFLLHSTR
jgi:hypothetical protein